MSDQIKGDLDLTAAENAWLRRVAEKALKECARQIDAVSSRYEEENRQNAAAMVILDMLTVAIMRAHFRELPMAEKALNMHVQNCHLRLMTAFSPDKEILQ